MPRIVLGEALALSYTIFQSLPSFQYAASLMDHWLSYNAVDALPRQYLPNGHQVVYLKILLAIVRYLGTRPVSCRVQDVRPIRYLWLAQQPC